MPDAIRVIKSREDEMGRACRMHGRDVKPVHNSFWKTCREETSHKIWV
jgi:hypothetical protein